MTLINWWRSLRCKHPEWRHVRTISMFEHRYEYDVVSDTKANATTTTRQTVEKHFLCGHCGTERIDYLLPDRLPPIPNVLPNLLDAAGDIARRAE